MDIEKCTPQDTFTIVAIPVFGQVDLRGPLRNPFHPIRGLQHCTLLQDYDLPLPEIHHIWDNTFNLLSQALGHRHDSGPFVGQHPW